MCKRLQILVPGALATLALGAMGTAQAAEIVWDGHYRTQIRYFNSLSLADIETNPNTEEVSWWADHRLRLQPGFLISKNVSIYTQLDFLPGVTWGSQPVVQTDLATSLADPTVTTYAVEPPRAEDGSAGVQSLQVRRAWGQLDFEYGQVRFGRMPVEWGTGLVWNAGDDPLDEYGDTSDRVQAVIPVGPIHLIGAFETPAENYVNQPDDIKQLTAGVAFLGEKVGIGTYNTYRWQKFDDDSQYKMFTGDLWAQATLGIAQIEYEFAFMLGGGDLSESINDVRVTGLGSVLNATIETGGIAAGLGLGIASGDQDPYDDQFRSFAFDPDYNVALMMFEEPMPTLAHENPHPYNNGGREYGAMRIGDGVRNAMYMRPTVGYQVLDPLKLSVAFIAAQATKVEEIQREARGYGSEIDFEIEYTPFEHFKLESTTGIFFPGKYIKEYTNDTFGGGFESSAVGSRLVGSIEF
jgi:hypothetical protein